MKRKVKLGTIALALAAVLQVQNSAWAEAVSYPDATPEGLVRIKSEQADAVYVLPDVDLSTYGKVKIDEPHIAFRSGWQREMNTQHGLMNVSDKDVEKMKREGKKLLLAAFGDALEREGFELTDESGSDVLLVKASILDLEVSAPNPDGSLAGWTKIYTRGAGSATLKLELFDSRSHHLLARAYDRKDDSEDSFAWQTPHTLVTNIASARRAFDSWADMLAHGLRKAKGEKL